MKQIDYDKWEQYLNGNMAEADRQSVEKELSEDPGLRNRFREYEDTLAALKRDWIAERWKSAGKWYLLRKWLMLGLATGVAILMVWLGWNLFGSHKTHLKQSIGKQQPKVTKNDGQFSLVSASDTVKTIVSFDSSDAAKIAKSAPDNFTIVNSENFIAARENQKNSDSEWLMTEIVKNPVEQIQPGTEVTKPASVVVPVPKFPVQTFNFNSKQEVNLMLKGGTKIQLPANCLLTADGNQYSGIAILTVREYCSYEALFIDRVGTVTKKGLLETAGSCDIRCASPFGDELFLKPGSPMTLNFRADSARYRSDMQLFTGKRTEAGKVIWETEGGTGAESGTAENPAQKAVTTLSGKMKPLHILLTPEYAETSARRKLKPDTVDAFLRYFGLMDSMSEKRKQKFRSLSGSRFKFTISPDGKIKSVHFQQDGFKVNKRLVRQFVKDLRHMGPDLGDAETAAVYLAGERELFATLLITDVNPGLTKRTGNTGKNYYEIQTSRFGLVNCDRFSEAPTRDYTLDLHDSMTYAQSFCLGFKCAIVADISGHTAEFTAPVQEPIVIIATGEINGEPYMQVFYPGKKETELLILNFDDIQKILKQAEQQLAASSVQ